jgi:hypothetical protein
MDNLIEAIRSAIAPDATDEKRAVGAQACRTILVALDTPAGETLKMPTAPTVTAEPKSQLEMVVTALRGLPPDQLLDLAIARLKAALPPGAEAPQTRRLNVPLVPMPKLGGAP